MDSLSPQPETISRLFDGVYPSFALLAGIELDLFTTLKDGPLTLGEIAAAIGVKAEKLRPLLYALIVAGLLSVTDGQFSNTAESDHYLVSERPSYLGGLGPLNSANWGRMLGIADTIRAGGPVEMIDYHEPSQPEMIAFFRGLYPGARADAQQLMDVTDFSNYESLLDVGGGSGALAITIAQAHERLKATVLELPSVAPVTQQFVAEAHLADRVTILTGDAVREPLAGSYDVVVARHVAQVLSEQDNRTLLLNLSKGVKPGGVIHLVGWVVDNSRQTPQNIVGYNLVLLTGYQDGQAYTEQEYSSWLTEAGFEDVGRKMLPGGASIITAFKPKPK